MNTENSRQKRKSESNEEQHSLLLMQKTASDQTRLESILFDKGCTHTEWLILKTLLWCHETRHEPTLYYLIKHSKLDEKIAGECIKNLISKEMIKIFQQEKNTHKKWIYLTKKGFRIITKLFEEIKQRVINEVL